MLAGSVTAFAMRPHLGCPGASRSGAAAPRRTGLRGGVPGQELFQVRAAQRFAAVAAAGGQVGQDVQACHLGGDGDGPYRGGEPGGILILGPVGVLAGHDGPAQGALGGVVVQADHRVFAVRGQPVPFPVQRGECLLRGFLEAGGGHLLHTGLIDRGECTVPGSMGLIQPGGGRGVPGGRQLFVRRIHCLDPVQPRGGPVGQLGPDSRPRPHEVPADMRPAEQAHQAVSLLAHRGIDGVEVAEDQEPPWPLPVPGELPGFLADVGDQDDANGVYSAFNSQLVVDREPSLQRNAAEITGSAAANHDRIVVRRRVKLDGVQTIIDLKRLAVDGFDEYGEVVVTDCVRVALRPLVSQIDALDAAIGAIDNEIAMSVKANETAKRLMTVPGVGPVTASAIVATIQDMGDFASGREFAAFLGLTPRQSSTGGKPRLGRVTKMGDRYLRKLLVVGACSTLSHRKGHNDALRLWASGMLERKTVRYKFKLTAVALANKVARIVFVLMTRGGQYDDRPVAA